MKGVAMNIKFDRAGVRLEADSFLKLQQCKGTRVECRSGSLWITQDRDLTDYVLGPGQTLELEHDGDAIVFALMQSELVLNEPVPQASLVDGLGEKLVNGLDSLGNWIGAHLGPEAFSKRGGRIWRGAF
jgi:DUF2917 family protein